jgi:multidrug efflux pump subunit AcrA (membrane-fusion protein)
LTLSPTRPYAPGVHGPQDDEGSFAAGRQSLLDALQSLEQRAHERAERMLREAERTARQLTLDSEQRAYQLTSEAEERARQTLVEAEQRAKQATLDTAQRLAELEQQLSEVRDNLEAARAQIEEQVVSVRGQVEVARASLNTVRQQLTSSSARVPEPLIRINPVPRPSLPRLSPEPVPPPRVEEATGPSLSDLRAAVDALKKPRREVVVEPATDADEPATIDETSDAARR